jgi:hypothetical protein
MQKTVLFIFIIYSIVSCEKEEKTNNSDFIETFDLTEGICQKSIEQVTLCFEKVLNDSRCPAGANCVWEGNATLELKLLTQDSIIHKFSLNTNPDFIIDTTIENIYVLMTGLMPNPQLDIEISPNEYLAQFTVANLEKLESNAQIIDFNTDKCQCCWGWTIVVGNDTIKSDDEILGKIIGYQIKHPVNVYIEKGALKQTCSDLDVYNYYELKKIVPIE